MKTFFISCCLFSLLNGRLSAQANPSENGNPDLAVMTKNYMAWWTYYNNHTLLSADFIPLGAGNTQIPKTDFFDSLITGNYVPIRSMTNQGALAYYLYALNTEKTTELNNIRALISNVAFTAYGRFKMQGRELPDYHFTDLKGNIYTKSNTNGKILVIKCWFINCKPCVAEMPALNKLVNSYRKRTDILFVSVALDDRKELEQFLSTQEFRYAVVPNQQDWLSNKLRADSYPLHILVDPKGKVVKAVNTEKELKELLAKELLP
jgi:thiol-disulfide isomerase/thioredoxin